MTAQPTQTDRLAGCLLGMAIGDALGLPCEGLGPARQQRMFPDLNSYHFVLGHGMISDDTEHACMTAQALSDHPQNDQAFARALAWKLRLWLLALPAGVGLATLRACFRLWLGWPTTRSGVLSAGNGPAMRAVILGVSLGHDRQKLQSYVKAATALTHRDPRAEAGALAIALASWMASQGQRDPQEYLEQLSKLCPEQPEFIDLIEQTIARLEDSLDDFIGWLGCGKGITGYMLHTVPAVIWFWLQPEPDFHQSLIRAIRCGGDTDTVAAILGGILAADARELPPELITGLWEWPRSVSWIRQVAAQLDQALSGYPTDPTTPLILNPFALLARNLIFLLIVLAHGFRRLAPPY